MVTQTKTSFGTFSDSIKSLVAAAETYGAPGDAVTVTMTAKAIDRFIESHSLVANPSVLGLESFTGAGAPVQYNGGKALDYDRIGANAYANLAREVISPAASKHEVVALAEEFARIVMQGQTNAAASNHFTNGRGPSGDGALTLSQIVGDHAYASVMADARGAMEAFGVNMDTIASDPRLNMTVVALRTHRSIMDRVLPRFVQEQTTVTIKKPIPEVYDLAQSRNPDPTIRHLGVHKQPVISLYTNPNIVSTEPKRVLPLLANDTQNVSLLADGVIKVGVRAPLLDLAATNQVGFNSYDYTDLLSEGGVVESLWIEARRPGTGSNPDTVSIFTVPVDYASSARFTMTSNGQDSRDRNANCRAYWIVKKDVKDNSGVANAVLADFTDANVEVDITFNASINLQSAFVTGSGSLAPKLVAASPTVPVSSATNTAFGTLQFTVLGYTVRTWYNEENLRKTTTALRMGTAQNQFEIPVGRSALVDFSMQQDEPQDVLELVALANSIGNSIRGLNIISSKLEVAKRQLDFEQENPNFPYMYKAANEFAAGSKCNPTVIDDVLDYDDGQNLAVLRESELLTEVHARMRARILSIMGGIAQRSLYHRNLAENETPVFKMVTSTYLKTVLLGIPDYHNIFNDRATDKGSTAEKADLSFFLQDGTRIDVVTTEFAEYADTLMFFPVREAEPGDVTSFAGIHDNGTFTCQFTPQNPGGSVNRRIVTNSREIVYITNPVVARLKVRNLQKYVPAYVEVGNLT